MARGRMRCEHNAALQRIVCDSVVGDEITAAFCGLIADEDAIGISGDHVVRDQRISDANQVNRATAIAGFVVLVDLIARLIWTTSGGAGEAQA